MEVWFTMVIIPLVIGIFVNKLYLQETVVTSSFRTQIVWHKEISDEYIRKLMRENISKDEANFWCNQVIYAVNTMMELYLQDRGADKALIEKLCNVKERCIYIMEICIDSNDYIESVAKLKSDITCLYNELITDYKKYRKYRPLISIREKAQLLLANLVSSTMAFLWAMYRGLINDEYTAVTIAVIVTTALIYYLIELAVIYLGDYIVRKIEKKKRLKHLEETP